MRDANNVLRFVMSGGYTSHEKSQNGFPQTLKKTVELCRNSFSFPLISQNTVAGFLCGVLAAYKSRNIFLVPSGFLEFLKLVVKSLFLEILVGNGKPAKRVVNLSVRQVLCKNC
jgi:hypothetical protein